MYLLELILMENPQYKKMSNLVAETCLVSQCTCRQHPLFSMCHIQGASLELWLSENAAWQSILAAVQQHPACGRSHLLPWLKEPGLRAHALAVQSLYYAQRKNTYLIITTNWMELQLLIPWTGNSVLLTWRKFVHHSSPTLGGIFFCKPGSLPEDISNGIFAEPFIKSW